MQDDLNPQFLHSCLKRGERNLAVTLHHVADHVAITHRHAAGRDDRVARALNGEDEGVPDRRRLVRNLPEIHRFRAVALDHRHQARSVRVPDQAGWERSGEITPDKFITGREHAD